MLNFVILVPIKDSFVVHLKSDFFRMDDPVLKRAASGIVVIICLLYAILW
jgi:hypothetical protein